MLRRPSTRLRFGPYRMPRFAIGEQVECLARGKVRIVGISDAPVQWPLGAVAGGKSPVLFGALVKAVQREAACAVQHNWGVSPATLRKWRRALGVPRWNEGNKLNQTEYQRTPAHRLSMKAM